MSASRRRVVPTVFGLAGGLGLALVAAAAAGAGQPRVAPPRWEYAMYSDRTGGSPWLVLGGREVVGHDQVGEALSLGRGRVEQGRALDALGSIGWELVDVTQDPASDALQFRFKRPL